MNNNYLDLQLMQPAQSKGSKASDGRNRLKKLATRFFLMLCIGTLLIVGCVPQSYTEEALLAYINKPENGLFKTFNRGNLEVSAFYKPTDLFLTQELTTDERSAEKIKQLREKYGAYTYFLISINKDGKDALYSTAGNYQEFSDNLQKLSFRMPEYLYMTTSSQDTVSLLDYHFSNMQGMSGSTDVLLAFEKKVLENNEWIQLNLKEVGLGTGRVNLRFRTKDILKTPEIDFLNQKIID
jgi:hypothetical protein